MDVEAASLPLTQVVTHGSVRVGFLEGFTLVSDEPDVLLAEANRLDVDVLCWSGGTHRFECFEYMDKFFVNPGSATGALTADWAAPVGGEGAVGEGGEEVVPSFCLMDVSLPLLFLGDGAGGEVFANRGVRGIGARDFPDVICLPAEERREWC
jgi:vacuolar protein sorting-associated protein 29